MAKRGWASAPGRMAIAKSDERQGSPVCSAHAVSRAVEQCLDPAGHRRGCPRSRGFKRSRGMPVRRLPRCRCWTQRSILLRVSGLERHSTPDGHVRCKVSSAAKADREIAHRRASDCGGSLCFSQVKLSEMPVIAKFLGVAKNRVSPGTVLAPRTLPNSTEGNTTWQPENKKRKRTALGLAHPPLADSPRDCCGLMTDSCGKAHADGRKKRPDATGMVRPPTNTPVIPSPVWVACT